MRPIKRALWITLVGLPLVIPLSCVGDDQKQEPKPQSDKGQSKKAPTALAMPVYNPPQRGAPLGRVGGGTRGIAKKRPVLSVLAPDHGGLTVQEQPSLFWHLSSSTTYPVEVRIINDRDIQPLLAKRLDPPTQPGVYRIRLADYGVRLLPGVEYQWVMTLAVDPGHRSKVVIAGAPIERIELPDALLAKLAQVDKAETPHVYAEVGLWYDALTAISDLIDATPDDPVLRKQRASLLKQVGLSEIAEYDLRPRRAD